MSSILQLHSLWRVIACSCLVVCSLVSPAVAEESPQVSAAHAEFFEKQVRPLLATHCIKCHSSTSGQAAKGGLSLDSRTGWADGGDSGPAIVPGTPDESLLIRAVRYDGYEMPPAGKLADNEIAILEEWVRIGAPDPRDSAAPATPTHSRDLTVARSFWSFQTPRQHAVPDTTNAVWPQSDVDRFILAKLEANGLSPAPDAAPAVWLRRITYDLTGLPPSPQELAAFVADSSPEARAGVIDRLLASPQFGVHWARHWLDLARYADSNGGDFNSKYPNAWRYRNYVIDAFNSDKPYDQFLIEQLAGDLLPASSENQRSSQLIATTFLTIGPKMLSERDKDKLIMDVVDEQIDTIGKAVLGLTLGCARCHDHKFDPIPTADYYALAGIFRSTVVLEGESQKYVSAWKETPLAMTPEHAEIVAAHQQQIDQLQQQLSAAQQSADAAKVKELEKKLADLKKQAPPPTPTAMAAREASQISDCHICIRGEIAHQGDRVPRGSLQIFGTEQQQITNPQQSGRLELAQRLMHPDNPLAARVIVNRIWQHVFGEGLVGTVDNFGLTGTAPTHPELLDTLAVRFTQNGWSVKQLVRTLVSSRTYAQSSQFDSRGFVQDPDNTLLWRAHRKRLPAEAVRDSLLSMSGELDLHPDKWPTTGSDRARTIFAPVVRNELSAFLTLFDFADPELVVGRRSDTNVPAQALYLLNDPFVRSESAAIAKTLHSQYPEDPQFISAAWQLILCRDPGEQEFEDSIQYLRRLQTTTTSAGSAGNSTPPKQASSLEVRRQLVQTLLASTEFRLLD